MISYRTSYRRPRSVLAAITALVTLASCERHSEQARTDETPALTPEPPSPLFEDVAPSVGIDFVHDNGGSGALYFVEPVGPGVALADLDGDGDLDIVLRQGRALPPATGTTTGTRIFANEMSKDQPSALSFRDVTDASGLVAQGYGMGVAAGDFDNDGRVDLYFTDYGHNQLWHNTSADGHITFEDVTARAGVDDTRWSTSAAFADVNDDGWLDLFVVNYVDFSVEKHHPCRSLAGHPDFCGPQSYEGESDRLFINRGNGTFDDVTGPAGILASPSSGLGVAVADFDRDGIADIYVANDLRRNFLWRGSAFQKTSRRYENVALPSGCAVSARGEAQASMGVVVGDIDSDGDDDLFMTHLRGDSNTLYVNDGRGMFTDRSAASGLGAASLPYTAFGTALFDFDNDGDLDIAVANGDGKVIEELARAGDPYPLKQPNQLFRNLGDGRFGNVAADASGFTHVEVSRGLAVGDIDNDGWPDLMLVNNRGPARLFLNRNARGNAWIGLSLRDHGRDALGATVEVVMASGRVLHRRSATDGSYLSANDPRILVGLADQAAEVTVRVAWPGGKTEEWAKLAPGRYHVLTAGGGRATTRVDTHQ